MGNLQPLDADALLLAQTVAALRRSNDLSGRFGLLLGETEVQGLARGRLKALGDTARVEFGEGILPRLIEDFCDSPYLTAENYADTLYELQDSFYYFKNEAMERLDDEELVSLMRRHFDGACQGSLEYLSGTALEELCRRIRYGREGEEDPRRF